MREVLYPEEQWVKLPLRRLKGKDVSIKLVGTSRTDIAVQLVLDVGLRPPEAAHLVEVDPSNLHRAIRAERQRRQRLRAIKRKLPKLVMARVDLHDQK